MNLVKSNEFVNEYEHVYNDMKLSGLYTNEQLRVIYKAVKLNIPPEGLSDSLATPRELEDRLNDLIIETEYGI